MAVALGLAPSVARASEGALRDHITVDAGATCLDRDALVDDVQTWLGEGTIDPELSIEVKGSAEAPRVASFRVLRGGRVVAYRRFEPGPARCEHLHAAMGLAIAMALKASLVEEVAPERPAAEPKLAPVLPLTAPPADSRAASTASTPAPWGLHASPLAALSVLPDAAFGAEVGLERSLVQFLSVRLSGVVLAARGETFGGAPGTFDAQLVAGRLDVCAAAALTPSLRARGCVGIAVGALRAQGYSYPIALDSIIPWVAAADGIDLLADLDRHWSLDAAVTLVLPLHQDGIVVRDFAGDLVAERRLATFGGLLAIGPVYRF